MVLVGFNYGGLVAGVAAARMPDRVHRIVYVDAFVPQPGRSLFDAPPPPVADQMRQLADEVGDGCRRPGSGSSAGHFALLTVPDEVAAEVLAATQ